MILVLFLIFEKNVIFKINFEINIKTWVFNFSQIHHILGLKMEIKTATITNDFIQTLFPLKQQGATKDEILFATRERKKYWKKELKLSRKSFNWMWQKVQKTLKKLGYQDGNQSPWAELWYPNNKPFEFEEWDTY